MPWTKEKDKELLDLFRKGDAPFKPDKDNKITAKTIEKVWDKYPIFRTDYTKRLFYQIYRRKAAEFLTDQAKEGARKKKAAPAASTAAEEEAEEAKDADFDSAAEAEEAEEAEEDTKPASTNDQTRGGNGDEGDDDDVPIADFVKMTLTEASTKLRVPALIYQYWDANGQCFVTADVLMLSGACVKDVHVEIDGAGRWVTVWVKIPEAFLSPARIASEDVKRGKRSEGSKPAALTAAATELREACDEIEGRVAMPFKFKLPVACKPVFVHKPFIGTYLNDWTKQHKRHNHYKILHIDLVGLQEPRSVKKMVKEAHKPMAAGDQLDTDSDEDSDSEEEVGDGDGDAMGYEPDRARS